MAFLPYIPLALGILIALAVPGIEDPARRQLFTGLAAILIGLGPALSGIRAVSRGRVRLKTRHAVREEQPATFWTAVILFRFGVGAVMIAAGVWTLLAPA